MAAQNAHKFVRWGGSGLVKFPVGAALPVVSDPVELIRADTPTPTAWFVILAVEADDPAVGAVSVDVTFSIKVGCGSSIMLIRRTVTVNAAGPVADTGAQVAGSMISVTVSAVPSAGPATPITLTVRAAAAPIASQSFNPC